MNITFEKFPITAFPVTGHTDFVTHGSTFFAFKGAAQNGTSFISKALQKGATTIVVADDNPLSDEEIQEINRMNAQLRIASNIRTVFAQECAAASDYAAKKVKIIGITGTKGKSTTTFLTAHILEQAGYKVALISTVGNKIDGVWYPGMLTTPPADYVHQFLALCVEKNVEYVVLEVSAQALSLQRIHGIELCGAIITNLYPDHSEFYPQVEDYFSAKMLILEHLAKNAPVIFEPSNKLLAWAYKTRYKKLLYKPVSITEPTPFLYAKTTDLAHKERCSYSLFYQKTKAYKERYAFCNSILFGTHNGENCLYSIGVVVALGIDIQSACSAIETFQGVPGRWQEYALPNGARAIIDYAHNPLSFYTTLSTMHKLTDNLIVIFGAGGERSKENRPHMGRISCMFAQKVILTTDNPRSEDPQAIVHDIMDFLNNPLTNHPSEQSFFELSRQKIFVELDRKKAIQKAYELSGVGSIIALLGKGPDEYQLIGQEKIFFSEAECLKQLR